MMDPKLLLDQWRIGLRISHRAHLEAAKYYQRLHLIFGLPSVVISALLSTAVFASMQHSNVTSIRYILSILSVVMVVMSSLQAFLRYAELSERHKTAAAQIGEVRRDLEQHLSFVTTPLTESAVEELRKKWDAADRQAPTIPTSIYTRVEKLVTEDESKNPT
jgi:hypothetical protein